MNTIAKKAIWVSTLLATLLTTDLHAQWPLRIETKTLPTCFDNDNGKIKVTVFGGDAPYTFNWAGENVIQGQQNQESLSEGMYAVTVTDDSDISVEETFEIIRLDSIEITPTLIHPDCADEDAILDLEVSGGLGPYTIDWSVTRSCYLGTGLGQAVYYVSVTDECGCISDQSYVLTEPEPIEIVGLIKSTSSCEATDGEIDITVSGGYPPYTFEWTGLDVEVNSMNQSGLSVGLYTVEVTDVTGVCVYTESFGISPEDLLEVNSTYSNPNCNSATGASDGTISLEISGGIPPYFYNWSGPGVIPEEKDQSNLSGGNYIVEVTDAVAQCIYYETYVLKEPESFEIEATLVNPSCNYDNGPANGGIDICIIGGNGGPYTFAWVGPGPAATAQNQAGLGAGTFTVFATDATGLCTQIATYELLEPQELVSNSVIIPSCAEEDGSIIIAASGGTAPYYYEIEGPNGYTSTEQNMSGLSTGSYKVTITDATGICTYEETINLTSGIPTTNLVLPVTDFAEDDDDLLLTGGFPQGGTYSGPGVSNNIFSPSSSGVGTHTITYTYTNTEGCTNSSTQDVVVTEMFVPDPPQNIITENDFGNQEKVTFNPTYNLENDVDVVSMNSSEKIISIVAVASDLTCHPDNAEPDGSITLEVSGGTPPYAYEWTGPGVVASAQNQTNLKAASYRVIVRDVSGLSQIAEFELSEPQAMNVTADITDPSCAYQTGYNDGEIFLVVTGGTVPYTYQWSDGSLGTENTDLDPGTYEVTITDSYGCKLVQSFELQQTTESEITYEQINTDCETERADIRININEGEGPYEITWNSATGGQMDQNFIIIFQEDTGTILYTNAEFGEVYDFTISDANGCLYELTVSINPSLTVEQVNPPHLCLITSDIETDYNTILWEDGEGEKRILFHFIYREDSSTGDFERIGIVEDHKDNTYTDRDVDNQGSAYRYYVTAVDPCYNESEPSAIHKTIHLQINQTESESIMLEWDEYEGLDYAEVQVLRGPSPSEMEVYETLPAGVYSYTDPNPLTGDVFYQIRIHLSVECTIMKQIFQLESNVAVLLGTTNTDEVEWINSIHPNPFSAELILKITEAAELTILDNNGIQVLTRQLGIGENRVITEELSAGFYLIQLRGAKDSKSYKLTKI